MIIYQYLQPKNKFYKEIQNDKRLFKPYKKVSNSEIYDFIKIFKEHFSSLYSENEKKFINARVLQSENVLAIEFCINSNQTDDEWINEIETGNVLELLAGFGFQKLR